MLSINQACIGNAEEWDEMLFWYHETVPWVQLSVISFCMAQAILAQSEPTIRVLKRFPVPERTSLDISPPPCVNEYTSQGISKNGEELSTHTPAVAVIAPAQGLQTGTVARDHNFFFFNFSTTAPNCCLLISIFM
ncbi:hypothetical protein EB796_020553 [Bugula neritina]|uniref:Uncharacterized protein n=1 Tax=Bugula neritina TaxID=10212 RepID=A0A7J7J5K1_BUGNE|nr:hypothetical protein EB796_020553 [Bugula neritina]